MPPEPLPLLAPVLTLDLDSMIVRAGDREEDLPIVFRNTFATIPYGETSTITEPRTPQPSCIRRARETCPATLFGT